MHNHKLKYRREIDGLRCVAVLPVIFFHAGIDYFSGGFVGVDIFFVISGYLITKILIQELENKSFSLPRFYERRAKRIIPALMVVTICCIPFAWIYMLPDELKHFGNSIVSIATFSSNIYFWRTSGYFSPTSEERPLLHTWSLAVEEQYYIFFPLLLMLLWGYGRGFLCVILMVFTTVSIGLTEWGAKYASVANFYLLPTRGWELLVGSLVAFISSERSERLNNSPTAGILSIIGMLLIGMSVFLYSPKLPYPSAYTIIPVLGTCLILVFSSGNNLIGRLLSTAPFVGIGLISYSAYLWHQPILAYIKLSEVDGDMPYVIIMAICVTFLLAWLTWKYVEMPFRDASFFRIKTRSTLMIAMVSLMGLLAIGFIVNKYLAEIKYRQIPIKQRNLALSAVPSPYRSECHKDDSSNPDPHEHCSYPKGSNAKIAVFGDSHAVELALAIGKQTPENGVAHFSYSACGPFDPNRDTKLTKCEEWSSATQKYIANNPQFQSVVIAYRIVAAACGDHRSIYPEVESKCKLEKVNDLIRTIEYFVLSGKKVYFVFQAPEVRTEVINIIYKESVIEGGEYVSVTRLWWDSRRNGVLTAIKSKLPQGVGFIDPAEIFCDFYSCYATKDNSARYFDDDHVSMFGAAEIAKLVTGSMKNAENSDHTTH